ncbi:MAG: hypothetical protein Q9169_004812 [Polycauliona sp. 2 TL-2023]
MATYVYDELDPDRRQIRICTIHPGSFDDPINCSLHTVSLDDNPEYETLSYAWGAPIFDHTISIDGAVLKVTKSLHNAMRYLRPRIQGLDTHDDIPWDPEASGILWADAACINQANQDERSSQVSLMGDIYRGGNRLHVWIGRMEDIRAGLAQKNPPGNEDVEYDGRARPEAALLCRGLSPSRSAPLKAASLDDEAGAYFMGAMEILEGFKKDKHVYDLPGFTSTTADTGHEEDDFWFKSMAMLASILTQPWWRRVWVVQEVLLSTSTQATLLHVGRHKMLLSACYSLETYFDKHLFGCCHGQKWPALIAEDRLGDAFFSIQTLTILSNQHEHGIFDMTSAFHAACSHEATSPHDYIYGLSALTAGSPYSGLKIDYRRPIPSLYAQATKAVFRTRRNLEFLDMAVRIDTEVKHGCPSWCIDWSESGKFTKLGFCETGLFDGAAQYSYNLTSPCDDDAVLPVEVTSEDHISCVKPVPEGTVDDPVHDVISWLRAIEYQLSKPEDETVLRVLMRDYYLGIGNRGIKMRISPQDMEIIRSWKSGTVVPPTTLAGVHPQPETLEWSFQRPQHLFVTDHGLLGAGPTTMKKGDSLFIVKGSSLPLVLRPFFDSAIEDREQQHILSYRFVGRCYVHGIMDGEAVTADTKWQTIQLR